MTWLKSVKWS